jgi:oligopeptide/dipeptide ABC transporter ATP-binding protein
VAFPRSVVPPPTRLAAIEGQPPNLVNIAPGCPFAPRCPKVQPRCRVERPPLEDKQPNQTAACFYPY